MSRIQTVSWVSRAAPAETRFLQCQIPNIECWIWEPSCDVEWCHWKNLAKLIQTIETSYWHVIIIVTCEDVLCLEWKVVEGPIPRPNALGISFPTSLKIVYPTFTEAQLFINWEIYDYCKVKYYKEFGTRVRERMNGESWPDTVTKNKGWKSSLYFFENLINFRGMSQLFKVPKAKIARKDKEWKLRLSAEKSFSAKF